MLQFPTFDTVVRPVGQDSSTKLIHGQGREAHVARSEVFA